MSDHLKNCREESGLSQDEVAKLLNITRQALSNWENGKTEPDAKMLAALSKIYGVPIDELIHGKPKKAPEEQAEEQAEEQTEEQTAEASEELMVEVSEEVLEELTEEQPIEAAGEQPEELMVEVPEEVPEEPSIESFAVVPEEPSATQKKSLSAKTRVLLLALVMLLGIAIGIAVGWYAHAYVQSHKVYEEQVDLSKPYDTFDLFPLEDN